FLQLPLEAFEQCNGIGGGPGESSKDFVVIQPPSLARRVLHHMIAHGHLAVADKHDFVVFAHTQNRGAVHRRTFLAASHPTIIAPEVAVHQKARSSGPEWPTQKRRASS